MRGIDDNDQPAFIYKTPHQMVPADHPLRAVKKYTDEILKDMSPEFDTLYSKVGRPSIPPEYLLKAQLLIAFFSIRSDRLFCEMLDYNILFRWFLDMNLEQRSWAATTFTKNRDRLLEKEIARKFFQAVVLKAKASNLMSDEHFTVDGSIVEAWASLKSFRPKAEKDQDRPRSDDDPGNPTIDFHGEKRSNDSHASTTDPESRLYRKSPGHQAKMSYLEHALMENRNGLLVDVEVSQATGTAEREAALAMLKRLRARGFRPKTVGGDKGYDTKDFIKDVRSLKMTPHVAANTKRRGGSALDGRTTRHKTYEISIRIRKRVEEIFGWEKMPGRIRRSRFIGRLKTEMQALLVGAAYNLIRMTKLLPARA